jgi:hypothetical protein
MLKIVLTKWAGNLQFIGWMRMVRIKVYKMQDKTDNDYQKAIEYTVKLDYPNPTLCGRRIHQNSANRSVVYVEPAKIADIKGMVMSPIQKIHAVVECARTELPIKCIPMMNATARNSRKPRSGSGKILGAKIW